MRQAQPQAIAGTVGLESFVGGKSPSQEVTAGVGGGCGAGTAAKIRTRGGWRARSPSWGAFGRRWRDVFLEDQDRADPEPRLPVAGGGGGDGHAAAARWGRAGRGHQERERAESPRGSPRPGAGVSQRGQLRGLATAASLSVWSRRRLSWRHPLVPQQVSGQ